MLATIPLLGKSSDLALLDIASFYNNQKIQRHKVSISNPVVINNSRRTRVTIASLGSTPYNDNNYINSFQFTYNRLDVNTVFSPFVQQGIVLAAPITTKKVLDVIKQSLPFINSDDEFIINTVFGSATSFTLIASPASLRWYGSIQIPITVVMDINDLLIRDYLDGLTNVDLRTPIDVAIVKPFLNGLQYANFLPNIHEYLTKDILKGLRSENLITPLSAIIESHVLNGHWVWEDEERVITSDLSLPSIDQVKALIEEQFKIPDTQYEIVSIGAINPDWIARGAVIINSSLYSGDDLLVFEKIDLLSLSPNSPVFVENFEDLSAALEEIKTELGLGLTFDEVDIVAIDEAAGDWVLTVGPNHPVFYGALPLADLSVGPRQFVSGLVPIIGTDYWKFSEHMTYSHGPLQYLTAPEYGSLSTYRAYWSGGSIPGFVIEQLEGNNYQTVDSIQYPTEPLHLSLTFDIQGLPVLSWEVNDQVYIRHWDLDTTVYETVSFVNNKSPFVVLSTFNENALDRQVLLIYVTNAGELAYRAQSENFSTEYVITNDVIDIVAIGRTELDTIKIEYVKDLGNDEYEIQNIATEEDSGFFPQPLESAWFGELTYYDYLLVGLDTENINSNQGTAMVLPGFDETQPNLIDCLVESDFTIPDTWVEKSSPELAPYGLLVDPIEIGEDEVEVLLIDTQGLDNVAIGNIAIINSERFGVTDIDTVNSSVTLTRGTLDTVPAFHDTGSIVYFYNPNQIGFGPPQSVINDVVNLRLRPRTVIQTLSPSEATQDSVTIAGRVSRPYPPARIRINDEYRPDEVIGELVISWANRNRITQGISIVHNGEGNIEPEQDTLTRVRIYHQGTLIRTYTSTGESVTYTDDDTISDGILSELTLIIDAIRDGIESYQFHEVSITRYGLGFQLGEMLGG